MANSNNWNRYKIDPQTVERIKAARIASGRSQTQFASDIEISQNAYSRIERGESRYIHISTLAKILEEVNESK